MRKSIHARKGDAILNQDSGRHQIQIWYCRVLKDQRPLSCDCRYRYSHPLAKAHPQIIDQKEEGFRRPLEQVQDILR